MTLLSVNIRRKSFVIPGAGDPLIVLDDVAFDVGDGEFVCVVGPSGCGKTTLLQLVAGLDAEFEGQITLDGERPGQGPRVGYLFQSPRLLPWMTVLENLRLVASKESVASALPERLLTDFDLQEFFGSFFIPGLFNAQIIYSNAINSAEFTLWNGSIESNIVSFTVGGPSAPTGLGLKLLPTENQLSWNPNPEPDIDHYNLYRQPILDVFDANLTYELLASVGPTSYADMALAIGGKSTRHLAVANELHAPSYVV